MEDQNIISISKAVSLYKSLTGKGKSKKALADEIHLRPHLGVWTLGGKGGESRQMAGVRKDRFAYFVKTRLLLNGSRYIFHNNEVG